jgi:folate-binding protein YgfZ
MNFPTYAAIFRWKPAAWLRITGSDAANFLQGQLSNDINGLAPGGSVYGLWLSLKGKVVADSFVIRGSTADEFWVGSYFSRSTVIREKLERFIIADDVVIEEETEKWSAVTMIGVSAEGAKSAVEGGFVFAGRRGSEPSCEWVFPADAAGKIERCFAGLPERTADEMERARIDAAIAAVPVDLGPDDLPNEGGLENVAISYMKGCYLGQEVIARLKSMGQVRRRLRRVRGETARPSTLPAALFVGSRQVGELRSAVGDGAGGFVGLAMLSMLHAGGDAALAFAPDSAASVNIVAS